MNVTEHNYHTPRINIPALWIISRLHINNGIRTIFYIFLYFLRCLFNQCYISINHWNLNDVKGIVWKKVLCDIQIYLWWIPNRMEFPPAPNLAPVPPYPMSCRVHKTIFSISHAICKCLFFRFFFLLLLYQLTVDLCHLFTNVFQGCPVPVSKNFENKKVLGIIFCDIAAILDYTPKLHRISNQRPCSHIWTHILSKLNCWNVVKC